MSGNLTHNPRLPSVEEVLPLNPRAIMLDGVEEISGNQATGFWTPTEEDCQVIFERGRALLPPTRIAEIFNQLAAYTVMHGLRESRDPHLVGTDNFRGRHPVFAGETVQVKVDVTPGKKSYYAVGELLKTEEPKYSSDNGRVAFSGLVRGVLLGPGETWIDEDGVGVLVVPEHAVATRRNQADRSHELYQALVSLDSIPKVETPSNAPRVTIRFETDRAVSVDGNVHQLNPDRTFLLNALLLNLGREIKRVDVEEMGFVSGSTATARQVAFSNAKNLLQRKLLTREGRPILQHRFGYKKAGLYQLDPNNEYVFYDRRNEPPRDPNWSPREAGSIDMLG